MEAAELIVRTLDRHLASPSSIRLLGGAAMVLAYGMRHATEDADLLLDEAEIELLAGTGFGEALEATNAELEPHGLYVAHIWGPEQQILVPAWRERCVAIPMDGLRNLTLSALGPLDLITSKLRRADAGDIADIRYLIATRTLAPADVREAVRTAVVPGIFRDVYAEHCARVEALLR